MESAAVWGDGALGARLNLSLVCATALMMSDCSERRLSSSCCYSLRRMLLYRKESRWKENSSVKSTDKGEVGDGSVEHTCSVRDRHCTILWA